MTVGGVLSEAQTLYVRFFKRFFLTAAAVFVLVDLLAAITQDVSDDGSAGLSAFWALVTLVASIVGFLWVQGALTATVADVRDGRADADIEATYRATRPVLLPLLGAGLLTGLGIVLGLVLLIVPGIVLLARWSVVQPVVVLERTGAVQALRRSWDLVRGHTWTALGVIVVTVVIAAVAQTVGAMVFSFLPAFFAAWIGGVVAHSISVPFVALSWTLMYFHLRDAA